MFHFALGGSEFRFQRASGQDYAGSDLKLNLFRHEDVVGGCAKKGPDADK